MKIADLQRRLRRDRPMIPVTLRIPEDVIEDLKKVAPVLGFSGYQPLMRAYIGQGLRVDLARLESPPELEAFLQGLRRRGVTEDVISEAAKEAHEPTAVPAVPDGALRRARSPRR